MSSRCDDGSDGRGDTGVSDDSLDICLAESRNRSRGCSQYACYGSHRLLNTGVGVPPPSPDTHIRHTSTSTGDNHTTMVCITTRGVLVTASASVILGIKALRTSEKKEPTLSWYHPNAIERVVIAEVDDTTIFVHREQQSLVEESFRGEVVCKASLMMKFCDADSHSGVHAYLVHFNQMREARNEEPFIMYVVDDSTIFVNPDQYESLKQSIVDYRKSVRRQEA